MFRHRRFAHCKELSNNKKQNRPHNGSDFGSAFKLVANELSTRATIVPCFLSI
jgi:hypothetical protein